MQRLFFCHKMCLLVLADAGFGLRLRGRPDAASTNINTHEVKMLTQARLKELVLYDETTGKFFALVSRGNIKAGSELTGEKEDYRQIHIDGKNYYAHRLAWLYVYGEMPSQLVDHIDGDKTNNRITNLRVVSSVENARNAAKKKGCASKYRGVSWSHGVWVAYIRVDGSLKRLGASKREEHAAMMYDIASLKYHGEYGRRNFYPFV